MHKVRSISLEIFSDPICPWCYIGYTYLERALQQVADHPFDIQWRTFQLNPDMPADGVDRQTYLVEKFSGPLGASNAYAGVRKHVLESKIAMNLSKIQRTPNTLNAHRLLFWAAHESKQNEIANGLFEAYFVEGRDIGRDEVLVEIANKAGFDFILIKRLLASDCDVELVSQQHESAHNLGIQSVPTFVLSKKHGFSGAQPTEKWLRLIEAITKDM
ncbi:MAG: DsbA family oxidoreductase [Aestuariivita sp.]|nr:DsbA family oxidoreductase [Aestuariivita sp.]MCY4345203.1 DsbA family oxidoreductase [Aestuariivita sp.]